MKWWKSIKHKQILQFVLMNLWILQFSIILTTEQQKISWFRGSQAGFSYFLLTLVGVASLHPSFQLFNKILPINLFSFCAKIELKLNELQKTIKIKKEKSSKIPVFLQFFELYSIAA